MLSNSAFAVSRDSMLFGVLNMLPVSAIVCNPDDVVLYWNGAATALYGWTADETVGRQSRTLFDTRAALIRKTSGDRAYLLRPSPELASRLTRHGQRVVVHRRAVPIAPTESAGAAEIELTWLSQQAETVDAPRGDRRPPTEKLLEKLRDLKAANAALAAQQHSIRATAERELARERRRANLAVQEQERLRKRLSEIFRLATGASSGFS